MPSAWGSHAAYPAEDPIRCRSRRSRQRCTEWHARTQSGRTVVQRFAHRTTPYPTTPSRPDALTPPASNTFAPDGSRRQAEDINSGRMLGEGGRSLPHGSVDRNIRTVGQVATDIVAPSRERGSKWRRGQRQPGCCAGTAPLECFLHILKIERVSQRRWAARDEVRRDTFAEIAGCCERQRFHSATSRPNKPNRTRAPPIREVGR